MGYIVCKIHGEQVADETSPFMKTSMDTNKHIEASDITRLSFKRNKKKSLILDKSFLINCNLNGIEEIDFSLENDKHINLYQNLLPVCPICFKEYLTTIGVERSSSA